jgi:trimethylamine:corrinoid methyltransferase-like protein
VNVWTCLDVVVYGGGLLSGVPGVAPDPVCRLLEPRSALKAATKPTPRITTAIEQAASAMPMVTTILGIHETWAAFCRFLMSLSLS